MYNLDGKVALVTGAGGERGLGRAIALRLAAQPGKIIHAYHVNEFRTVNILCFIKK